MPAQGILGNVGQQRFKYDMAGTGSSNGHERIHPIPGNRVSNHRNGSLNQPPVVPIGQRINQDGTVINQRGESEESSTTSSQITTYGQQGQLLKGSGGGVMLQPNIQRNSLVY